MPLVTGELASNGAVIAVLVNVSENRKRALKRNNLPLPAEIAVRAQIDTGSFASAFMPSVFRSLGIPPFRFIRVRTPSTKPDEPFDTPLHDVSITLVSGLTRQYLPSVHAIAVEDFGQEEGVDALIGRDVLARCVFEYSGVHGSFRLAF
jgi:hypothetical protein